MIESLSDREIAILRLAADGFTNAEVAAQLSLSLNTVKWYNKRIYEKLGVESRTQAIQRGQRLGLLSDVANRTDNRTTSTLPHASLPTPLTTIVGRRIEVDTALLLPKRPL